MARLGLFDVLDSYRIGNGVYALALKRFIKVKPETDITTVVVYDVKQQRYPIIRLDEEYDDVKDEVEAMIADASFGVSVLERNGRTYITDMTMLASRIVHASANPLDLATTIVMYDEDSASALVRYIVDMPLITGGGAGGAVGFFNMFNSVDGTPPATPTSEAEEEATTPPSHLD